MIILEREDCFFMVTQQDHAKISGDLAVQWKEDYFPESERKQDVVQAIYEHDRGWIELDKKPLWNEVKQQPYSFTDFPTKPKIASYARGIEEVGSMSSYAELLCSLHYTSFLEGSNEALAKAFCEQERKRQEQILKELGISGNTKSEQEVGVHLAVLKFCDNLSLYMCLNEPGVDKANEHPFFRNGFPQKFAFANHQRIIAQWPNPDVISLSFSPFEKAIQLAFPYKKVSKAQIQELGLVEAYLNTPVSYREVEIR